MMTPDRPGHHNPDQRARLGRMCDPGFTLIELLISMTILPIVIGAVSVGLLSVFSLQARVNGRLTGSLTLQTTMATFIKDVQSSSQVETNSSTPACDPTVSGETQLLGLKWSSGQTVVSYVEVPMNNGATINRSSGLPMTTGFSVERVECTFGSSTPSTTSVISYDAQPISTQPPASLCISATSCSTSYPSFSASSNYAQVDLPLYIALGSSPYYTLIASPRNPNAIPGGLSSNGFYAPINLLGLPSSGCGTLSVSPGATLTINVNGGSANGLLAVGATCSSGSTVQLAQNSTINAGGIIVTSPGAVSGSTPVPIFVADTESFVGTLADLTPPPNPTGAGSCIQDQANNYYCSPGIYGAYSFSNQTNSITFYGGGSYSFTNFSIPNGAQVTFGPGAYIFNASSSSGSAFTTGNSANITGNGALFYAPYGNMDIGNNSYVNLTPPSGYQGVTIWDAGGAPGSGTATPIVTLGNNSSYGSSTSCSGASFGGIYVPYGIVKNSSNGTICTSFIVAGQASFWNNTTVTVTP